MTTPSSPSRVRFVCPSHPSLLTRGHPNHTHPIPIPNRTHWLTPRARPLTPIFPNNTAGVLQSELADWADSPARGTGRFSYLYQNTLVQPITFVGACQTASHGSGFLPPTPDYIIAMTIINANGEIKYYDRSHPDLRVMAACLGMCGIVLDVTVKFNPDVSATKVTQKKLNYQDLIPPRGVPINDSYNPLKCFIEGHNGGGAINYAPFNSAVFKGIKLDKNRIDEYHGYVPRPAPSRPVPPPPLVLSSQ